jgi:peptide deformylase
METKEHTRRALVIAPAESLNKEAWESLEGVDVIDILADMAGHLVETGEKVIAAPQVGEPYPLLIVLTPEGMCPMIVPDVIKVGKEIKIESEWCSSVPNRRIKVPRNRVITVKYADIEGKVSTEVIKGELARSVLHGLDHLDGILITNY